MGVLPASSAEYYASKEVAMLACDVDGCKCIGHFWREGMEIEDVSERQISKLHRPDQPTPLHAKKYLVPAACDAFMLSRLEIYC